MWNIRKRTQLQGGKWHFWFKSWARWFKILLIYCMTSAKKNNLYICGCNCRNPPSRMHLCWKKRNKKGSSWWIYQIHFWWYHYADAHLNYIFHYFIQICSEKSLQQNFFQTFEIKGFQAFQKNVSTKQTATSYQQENEMFLLFCSLVIMDSNVNMFDLNVTKMLLWNTCRRKYQGLWKQYTTFSLQTLSLISAGNAHIRWH